MTLMMGKFKLAASGLHFMIHKVSIDLYSDQYLYDPSVSVSHVYEKAWTSAGLWNKPLSMHGSCYYGS